MKLAIVGSVNIDEDAAWRIGHKRIVELKPTAIVSGGADGTDKVAEKLAAFHGLPCIVCKPAGQKWEFFKPRNLLVAEICDRLIRIYNPDTKTYGSGWTHDQAERMGKPVESIPVYG